MRTTRGLTSDIAMYCKRAVNGYEISRTDVFDKKGCLQALKQPRAGVQCLCSIVAHRRYISAIAT